jgi:hypothetical protein
MDNSRNKQQRVRIVWPRPSNKTRKFKVTIDEIALQIK